MNAFDPRSWSLDSWLTFFQVLSALALSVTVVLGFFLTRRQARTIRALEISLEVERNKRLELQAFVNPRQLPDVELGDDPSTLDVLRPFAREMRAKIEYFPDNDEVWLAANAIANALREAGWTETQFVKNEALKNPQWNGVNVLTYKAYRLPDDSFNTNRSEAAAKAILDLLGANKWEAYAGKMAAGEMPPEWLRILVGFKRRARTAVIEAPAK